MEKGKGLDSNPGKTGETPVCGSLIWGPRHLSEDSFPQVLHERDTEHFDKRRYERTKTRIAPDEIMNRILCHVTDPIVVEQIPVHKDFQNSMLGKSTYTTVPCMFSRATWAVRCAITFISATMARRFCSRKADIHSSIFFRSFAARGCRSFCSNVSRDIFSLACTVYFIHIIDNAVRVFMSHIAPRITVRGVDSWV